MTTSRSIDREKLSEELAEIEKAIQTIDALSKPLRTAESALVTVREAILDRYGAVIYDKCECGALILIGDKYHHCRDGEMLCEECAPTYADVKKQVEERIAEGRGPDQEDLDMMTVFEVMAERGDSLDQKSVVVASAA